jgi:hypothetical protein
MSHHPRPVAMAYIHLLVGLNSGDDCLPKTLMKLNKPVIRKIIAEDGANTTPD